MKRIELLERRVKEVKAEVLQKPQVKASALEAVAEANPAFSALSALSAGPVVGAGLDVVKTMPVEGEERAEHVVERVGYFALLYEERCEKEAMTIKSIYARTAWRALKVKEVPGEIVEFEKLPQCGRGFARVGVARGVMGLGPARAWCGPILWGGSSCIF